MVRAKNFNQIIRMDGKNVFVEFLDSGFEIGKVLINFVKYDGVTNKQTDIITYYLDFEDFMVLKQDVLTGRLSKLAEIEKAKKKNFPGYIYMQQGGVSAENLAKRNQSRPDGMSLARQLKILPGDKYPFMFQAEQGKGEQNEKGLIVSRFGSKPDSRIMVPMQGDDLKKIVLMIDAKIQAYMSAQYVYMYKQQFNKQAEEVAAKRAKHSRQSA